MRRSLSISVVAHGLLGLGLLMVAIPSVQAPPPMRAVAVSLARLPSPAPAPVQPRVETPHPPKPAAQIPKPSQTRPKAKPLSGTVAAPSAPVETVSASLERTSASEPVTKSQPTHQGGDVDASPDAAWLAQVRAVIERHKRYPVQALKRREEGMAVIRFLVTREGGISAVRVVQGSGSEALDREAGELPGRAGTFPPMPQSMKHDRLELSLPVTFALR